MSIFSGRKFGCGRVIIFLVLLVVGLQVFHMGLLMKLETKGVEPREITQRYHEEDLVRNVVDKIGDAHVSDTSGMYHVIPNILTPKFIRFKEDSENITLVTQTSANHLDYLTQLSQVWQGPISVSVFTYKENIFLAIKSILYFQICYPSVKEHVSFHLVYPMNSALSENFRNELSGLKITCDETFISNQKSVSNYAISGIEYPHNILRNLAIKFSLASFIFMIDIDMVPSPDLATNFMKFIGRRSKSTEFDSEKTVFVVPSFESKDLSIPSSKSELLKAWELGSIRPFYSEACWKCQRYTEYDKWRKLFHTNIMDIGYSVEWRDPWEPFFIASKRAPLYDERFKQYGFNRISQVCELYVAGYNFVVLNNAFLVHKCFKVKGKFHKSKELEQERNRLLFRKFKEELKVRYPDSLRRC